MMMTSSQFGLEDMEALLWEPSFPTADAMSSLFFKSDQEPREGGGTSLEGDASPASPLTSSSLSSSSSPHPFYSPPPSPPAVLLREDKAGGDSDPLALPSLGHPGQLRSNQMISDYCKESVFGDLDWMAERVDLSELDLDCLIGSCNTADESPSCAEDLLSSLEYSMEIDPPVPSLPTPVLPSFPDAPLQSLPVVPDVCSDVSVIEVDQTESCVNEQEAPSPLPSVPEPQEELEIKSEPATVDLSSPLAESPSSPADTLDLGSEVDVSESEVQPAVATVVPRVPRLVLSLSPTRIVLVLAPKDNVIVATTTTKPEAIPSCPPHRSTRSRPYPEPGSKASACDATSIKVKSVRGAGGEGRVSLKAPRDKKTKKMEQNKTAATRYRQKKRAEQEALLEEHVILERKNMELTERAESMAREIEYLKELMEEVQLARVKKALSDP